MHPCRHDLGRTHRTTPAHRLRHVCRDREVCADGDSRARGAWSRCGRISGALPERPTRRTSSPAARRTPGRDPGPAPATAGPSLRGLRGPAGRRRHASSASRDRSKPSRSASSSAGLASSAASGSGSGSSAGTSPSSSGSPASQHSASASSVAGRPRQRGVATRRRAHRPGAAAPAGGPAAQQCTITGSGSRVDHRAEQLLDLRVRYRVDVP